MRPLLLALGTIAAAGAAYAADAASGPTTATAPAAASIRPPAVAGSWYPADAAELRKLMDRMMQAAKPQELPGPPAVLIVPHAGYQFSGATAAAAFKVIEGKAYTRVVLLGPSHHVAYATAAVPTVTHFATPLGQVPLDRAACDALAKADGFAADDRPHAPEHALEAELPFLQVCLKDFRIVPVLLGQLDAKTVTAVAAALRPLLDDKTLLVVSSDFTHYGPNYRYLPFDKDVEKKLVQLDGGAIDRILAVDRLGLDDYVGSTGATICGHLAISAALQALADKPDAEGVVLGYTTSGALTKDWTNSVSYAALAVCRDAASPLTAAEQQVLLQLARDQVREYLKSGKELADADKRAGITARLSKPGAAFVTLTRAGRLRGCIGHVIAFEPLYRSVQHNAISALRDPRFTGEPVTAAEEPALHVEISVLGRHRQVGSNDEIQIGRDGLIIRRGPFQGLFLPQVPVEQKWNLQQYLENLCYKAGLPASALKDPDTRISRFPAQVFGEKEATTQKN